MALSPAVQAPDWSELHHRGAAKCRDQVFDLGGKDIFFEEPDMAMQVCNGGWDDVVCPRRTECLRVAMLNSEAYGVWGGMTPTDRLRLRTRYPGAPERWIWHPPGAAPFDLVALPVADEEVSAWPVAA